MVAFSSLVWVVRGLDVHILGGVLLHGAQHGWGEERATHSTHLIIVPLIVTYYFCSSLLAYVPQDGLVFTGGAGGGYLTKYFKRDVVVERSWQFVLCTRDAISM